MTKVPKLEFNDMKTMPIIGIGTWKSQPGQVTQAVKDAIDIGYRHIDCAHVYGNEKEVGAAIKAKIDEGVVERKDLFITSKLWNTFHSPGLVEGALKVTLENLELEYIDLYLIHWPLGYKEGGALFPTDEKGAIEFSDIDYRDTWKAMEEVCKKGLTKSIGLSNFNFSQINNVLEMCTIKPAVVQVECHPYLNQKRLIAELAKLDIRVVAYSPLGSPDRPWAKPEDPQLLADTKLLDLAAKHNKTPAQILIRYQIERGVGVIPKSVTKGRIEENFKVFDFELDGEDLKNLAGFDCGGRFCPMTPGLGHKYHPFENDEF